MTVTLPDEFQLFLTSIDTRYSQLMANKTPEFYKNLASRLAEEGFERQIIIGDDEKLDGVFPYNACFYVVGVKGIRRKWVRALKSLDGSKINYAGHGPYYDPLMNFSVGSNNLYVGVDIDGTIVNSEFSNVMHKLVYRYAGRLFRSMGSGRPGSIKDLQMARTVPVSDTIGKDLEASIAFVAIAWAMGYRGHEMEGIIQNDLLNSLRLLREKHKTMTPLSEYVDNVIRKIETAERAGGTQLFPDFRQMQYTISSPENIHPYVDLGLLGGIRRVKESLESDGKKVSVGVLTKSHRYRSWLEYAAEMDHRAV